LNRKLVWFTAGIVIVTSILLAATYLSGFLQYSDSFQYNSFFEVNRVVNNASEEQALTVAETIDYNTITRLERFDGSSDANEYIQPGTYIPYTWANFIDADTIDYYQSRYEYQQKQSPKGITFTYNANVTYLNSYTYQTSPRLNKTQLLDAWKTELIKTQLSPITKSP
jgi:hypothetical protein